MQPTRFAPSKWDLKEAVGSGYEKNPGAFADLLRRKSRRFEGLRMGLGSMDPSKVDSALRLYEEIEAGLARVNSYSFMRYSADTADEGAKAALDKAEDLQAELNNRSLFLRLWWAGLSESAARKLRPKNEDFGYVLDSWRKLKPYTLAEDVERAVNLKNLTGFSSWSHHYDKVTSRFTFEIKVRGRAFKDEKGKARKLVVDEVTRLFTSPDPEVRVAAYRTLLGRYAQEGAVLGEVYRIVVRDWRNENVKLRGYATPIATRNLENDVPDEAVETLLTVCSRNANVFQSFFTMKAKLLGLRTMSRYHLYAPLSPKEKQVGYDEAVRTVVGAFAAFDARVSSLALRVFERNHVDSSPRQGKRSGAYCMSVVPSVVPFMFLNFAGMSRDVYTIAHESGHAIHSQLASSHSALTFHPPLVLAETASVFGEMMLFDKTMNDERDAEVKRSVLLDKISSMYGTIGRQAHFVMFEKAAHDRVESGATVEDLCDEYLGNLKGQFGSAVTVPDEFRWEWTYIPHMYHTPFYCYAYAFGNLLSLALYDRYTKEGKSFVPQYLKILSYGGSKSPPKILEEVGFDMRSGDFWQGGFDVIGRMVDQLRKL